MKFWKWIVKCPMLFLLTAGWAGLTIYTWSEGKLAFALDQQFIENPAFTALLQPEESLPDSVLDDYEDNEGELSQNEDLQHHFLDQMQILAEGRDAQDSSGETGNMKGGFDLAGRTDAEEGTENNADADVQKEEDSDAGSAKKDQASENNGSGQEKTAETSSEAEQPEEIGVTSFKKTNKIQTDSPYYSDPGKKALTTSYSYQKVDKSYFDDAVFIGDSRTVGMQDYSGLDNADFFAKTGMTVYEVLDDKCVEDPDTGREVSVAQMLKKRKYGKIYFMVGINELGTGNTGTFQKAYERVIQKFRKLQPDAVIYIQGIIPVSKAKAVGDAVFNNVNINDKNVAIAQLADGINVFYLDVSDKLTDKKGYLKADYTSDDVHMYAQHYQIWLDYLMEHAVVH